MQNVDGIEIQYTGFCFRILEISPAIFFVIVTSLLRKMKNCFWVTSIARDE